MDVVSPVDLDRGSTNALTPIQLWLNKTPCGQLDVILNLSFRRTVGTMGVRPAQETQEDITSSIKDSVQQKCASQ